jgi:hypothetical protein
MDAPTIAHGVAELIFPELFRGRCHYHLCAERASPWSGVESVAGETEGGGKGGGAGGVSQREEWEGGRPGGSSRIGEGAGSRSGGKGREEGETEERGEVTSDFLHRTETKESLAATGQRKLETAEDVRNVRAAVAGDQTAIINIGAASSVFDPRKRPPAEEPARQESQSPDPPPPPLTSPSRPTPLQTPLPFPTLLAPSPPTPLPSTSLTERCGVGGVTGVS